MVYLDDWVSLKGSALSYPINDGEKRGLRWQVQFELRGLAIFADFIFAERDDARARANGFQRGTPERAAADLILATLEGLADDANRKYSALWDLYVTKLEILKGPEWTDRNKYRESTRFAE
jgi:hypothetical protein